ncbi:MAG: PD40 domain-containing protein [Actinobacteria bacterium]|nr:PD40 domain-containing protein [Actinomycetota bacterium]
MNRPITMPKATTGRRHGRRALIAATAAVVAVCAAVPASAVASAGQGPSTRGVIVWTDRTASGDHLMIARADGSHARSLTQVIPGESDIDAQISPDGRWVVYEHDTAETAVVRLVRSDGTDDHLVNIRCVAPCVAIGQPTWLSNSRLAYIRVDGPFDTGFAASGVLWTSRLDGTHERRFSEPGIDGRYEDTYLHVSADGSYVTFRRNNNALDKAALFRADPDGRHPHQLTPYALNAEISDLSTASRGTTKDLVVFETFGRGSSDDTFVDIATVPTTCGSIQDCTSKIVWLTDNATTGRRNANPQWSPDGTSIVFTDRASVDVSDAEIWTMRYLGTQRRKISNSPDFDFRPTWGVRAGSRA